LENAGIDAKFIAIGSEGDGYRLGMQGGRIFAYDVSKNWWSRAGVPSKMPVGEPGGPDSEMFYDFGTPHDPKYGKECHPNCDCGRFMEIGNTYSWNTLTRKRLREISAAKCGILEGTRTPCGSGAK